MASKLLYAIIAKSKGIRKIVLDATETYREQEFAEEDMEKEDYE